MGKHGQTIPVQDIQGHGLSTPPRQRIAFLIEKQLNTSSYFAANKMLAGFLSPYIH